MHPATSARPPASALTLRPKTGSGSGVHEDALPFIRACCFMHHLACPTPRLLSPWYSHGGAFPCSAWSPLTLQPPAPRRQGRCSCQPGSSGESKLSFANAAEITGLISGHMAVSSGREEAAAASLPNS